MPFTFKTFVIRIIGPDPREEQSARAFDRERADVSEVLRGSVLGEVEELINDELPESWQAKVSEWDS